MQNKHEKLLRRRWAVPPSCMFSPSLSARTQTRTRCSRRERSGSVHKLRYKSKNINSRSGCHLVIPKDFLGETNDGDRNVFPIKSAQKCENMRTHTETDNKFNTGTEIPKYVLSRIPYAHSNPTEAAKCGCATALPSALYLLRTAESSTVDSTQ